MTKKILFLFFLFLPLFQACSAPATVIKIKNPPTDFFVKIFKKLEITRCHKEKPKKGPICETRTYTSVGSGLMIKLTSGKKIILSAGHVCDTRDELVEEKVYYYQDSKGLKDIKFIQKEDYAGRTTNDYYRPWYCTVHTGRCHEQARAQRDHAVALCEQRVNGHLAVTDQIDGHSFK